MLRLWNTATKRLEDVRPITPGRIGFYACGPTVYQRAHIGNLRAYVMEDVVRRALTYLDNLNVKHVMNITDVGHLTDDADEGEDKLEKAAREEGATAWDVSQMYTRKFTDDLKRLNILEPSVMPKATDHIAEQIELVKTLEEKGFTYRTNDGVYFDTSKLPSYGSFGGQRLVDKEAGARVETNPEKLHPSDFALWKFSPADAKRQMEWESPWGVGFPGWHIECSAMSRKELGQPFDIHAGGVDHVPVHHENEIAQSVAAYGIPLANHWMHVEFLLVDGQKMSKSLKNTYSLDDLREKGIDPAAYRLFLLGAHYRSKQNFTWEAVHGASQALLRLQRVVRSWDKPATGCADLETAFRAAIEDDLNTPEALAVLWKTIDSDYPTSAKASTVLWMDRVLGLMLDEVVAVPLMIPVEVKQLADTRWKARQERDWQASDKLRDELLAKGWEVDDGKEGYVLKQVSR
ncbi:MAG TPA: cysteine--tRNA ligase [Candidatus Methylomirabilis sp.]|nr:cysteine--tRNA ligase [Candidatus Methylomirabilis sp.]